MRNKNWLSTNVPAILALALVALAFALFFIVILVDVTREVRDITMVIIGLVGASLGQVYSFYFGSSEGSRNKDREPESLITTVSSGGGGG